MVAIIPVIVLLLGLVLYALPINPKVQQLGYALFCVGAFFTVSVLSGRTIRLL